MVMRAFAQSTARRASTGGTSVRTRWIRRRLAAVTLVIALAAIALAPAGALAQFQLGLEDGFLSQMPATAQTKTAFGVLHQAAASTIRIPVAWSGVAPVTLPANFDPANPGDRHYHWGAVDAAVQNAVANGARPLLVIYTAPTWAQPANKPAYDTSPLQVAYEPNAQEYGRFAHAVAARYSGKFADPQSPTTILPRVKLFEIWNEENLKGSLDSPDLVTEYRSLLNASYARIKSVHPDNVVSVGGLAPVFVAHQVMSPLKFAARLMCLTRVRTHYVRAACPVQAHFDAFSIHPYSLASTPTLHAFLYDDTLVADMGKVRALLRAAEKLHTTQPHIPYALWVSEWSWFSNPPDELIGDPDRTAARYTAYGLYEMWKAGTNLVIWLKVLYPPGTVASATTLVYGGALYGINGLPTLKLRAFEFPVVASVNGSHGFVWGRAPVTRRTKVFVQHLVGRRWQTIASVRTGRDGIFEMHFKARHNGFYRARVRHGRVSLAYNSRSIPPKRIHACASGCT